MSRRLVEWLRAQPCEKNYSTIFQLNNLTIKKMIKAIIFDFDGVLVESAHIKTEAFRKIFSKWPGNTEEGVAFHLKNMGVSRYIKFKYFYENIIRKPYSERVGHRLGKEFSDIVLSKIKVAPFVKGAKEFLENYYSKYKFFVISGTPEKELREIISFKGIDGYFAGIYGSPSTKKEIVNKIMGRDSLNSNLVVFVGDAESDRKVAEDTGVHFVLRVTSENHAGLNSCEYKIGDMIHLHEKIKELDG